MEGMFEIAIVFSDDKSTCKNNLPRGRLNGKNCQARLGKRIRSSSSARARKRGLVPPLHTVKRMTKSMRGKNEPFVYFLDEKNVSRNYTFFNCLDPIL